MSIKDAEKTLFDIKESIYTGVVLMSKYKSALIYSDK